MRKYKNARGKIETGNCDGTRSAWRFTIESYIRSIYRYLFYIDALFSTFIIQDHHVEVVLEIVEVLLLRAMAY